MRRKTFVVNIGGVKVGGDNPISIQSMLCAPPDDIESNVAQARALYEAGCDIVRTAITKPEDVRLIDAVKAAVPMPLVADIQYDYRLAIASAQAGVDKVRINPGNIGSESRVEAVLDACAKRGLPIRIGVNSGSLEKEILAKYGRPTTEALVESAMLNIDCMKRHGFSNYLVAIKSSDVFTTIEAYRAVAARTDCPLHLGVTEAGSARMGLIKSAAAFGALLEEGIGDTLRVSLTADPVQEVYAARDILRAVGLARNGVQIISCPTCGRCRINLIETADKLEKALSGCEKNLKVAVMGCAVNGIGEANDADIGLAGGDGEALIFSQGKVLCKVPMEDALETLLKLVEEF